MKSFSVALVALLALLFGGCHHSTAPSPASVVVTEAHSGTSVTLAVRGELTVRLGSNPSTGYSWQMTTTPAAAVLRASGSGYEPASADLPGASGIAWWTFNAVAPGATSLHLTYVRAWEPTTAAQEFTLQLVVR